MTERITIDTNIAIHGFKSNVKALDILNGKDILLSFITPIELLSYAQLSVDEENLIRVFISQCYVHRNSIELEDAVIKLRKTFLLKIPDAFIAATALHYNIPFFSSDSVFERIPNLNFVFVEF